MRALGPGLTRALAIVALSLAGCGGGGGGDADESGETEDTGTGEDGPTDTAGTGVPSCGEDGLPGDSPLRRLTHWEYNNTVRDLLGDDSRPADAFPTDANATGFDNEASSLGVTSTLAEEYMRAAEDMAARAVTDLDVLLPCDPSDNEVGCGEQFIDSFGAQAFRRPLTPTEQTRLLGLFGTSRDDYGFDKAIELVLQAFLQSPQFLYRVELGMPDADGAGVVPLSEYEVASRLSYLLWGTMPDAELFAAAADGALGSPGEVSAQALRMLDDPRARDAVASFHSQWLGLDEIAELNKDTSVFPEWDEEFKTAIESESLTFLDHVVFDGEGDLDTILLANYTFANADLASFYGVTAPGSQFVRVDLDPNQRSGILTHASFLAATGKPNQSSPVLRGRYVREQLMCQTLPEPPPDVDTTPPEVSPDATTRERFEQHMSDPTCASCHVLIDPIGFGFEHYDGVGRWRDDESGLPIDASGEVVGTAEGDVSFDGALELAQVLAGSQEVRECFVEKWFTYTHGRAPGLDDECSQTQLRAAFEDNGRDVRQLLIALTQTDAFLYRNAPEGT